MLNQSRLPQQPLLAPTRTSRTVVIGLGDFGLHVISLLLPRLETYAQFVDHPAPAPKQLTRCGLVARRSGHVAYCDLDRDAALRALCTVHEIQHAVLAQHGGTAATTSQMLHTLLGIDSSWDSASSQHDWVVRLLRPILADAHDYATTFAHLHVYLIVSADDMLMDDMYELARTLKDLKAAISVSLIVNVGFTTSSLWRAEQIAQQAIDRLQAHPQRAWLFHQIYVVDHSKINQALTEVPGEAAMMVCNFIDTAVFSTLGDTVSERLLPDTYDSLFPSPYNALGAAKLYIPVGEISSELVGSAVAKIIRERLTQEPSPDDTTQQVAAAHELDLFRVGSVGVVNLPITLHPRFNRWQRFWMQRPQWRSLSPDQEEDLRRQRLLIALPRVRLRRRYWRAFRQAYGRRLPTDVWWLALQALEADVARQLPNWLATAAAQIGVSLPDEQLAAQFAQALAQVDPLVQELQTTPVALRAAKLGDWMIAQRPDLATQSQRFESDAAEQFAQADARHSNSTLGLSPSWLGWWLWLNRPASDGYLGQQLARWKQQSANLIAHTSVGMKLTLIQLAELRANYEEARQRLAAQAIETQSLGAQMIQQLQQQRLEHHKQRLVAALRSRPYWSAWLVRLLLVWGIPLSLALLAVQNDPAAFPGIAAQPISAAAWWTVGVLAFYTLIMLASMGRIWLAKRRIETLILARIDQQIEAAFYAGSGTDAPGPVAAYLNAFERLMVAPAHDDLPETASLLATLESVYGRLNPDHQADVDVPSMPQCVVYQSICDDAVRYLLETRMQDKLRPEAGLWQVDPGQINQYLHAPTSLTAYIQRTLRTLMMDQYTRIARSQPELQLQSLLRLPEYRMLVPAQLVADLRLRAKPFLDFSSVPQASTHTRETISYISVPDTTPLLIPEPNEHHVFANRSCDPFAISCTTIIHGIAYESLPFTKAGVATP